MCTIKSHKHDTNYQIISKNIHHRYPPEGYTRTFYKQSKARYPSTGLLIRDETEPHVSGTNDNNHAFIRLLIYVLTSLEDVIH